jgi:hypothetical protein
MMFPGVILSWTMPENSVLMLLAILMIAWGVILCILGGLQGLFFAFGRLKMGCPLSSLISFLVYKMPKDILFGFGVPSSVMAMLFSYYLLLV